MLHKNKKLFLLIFIIASIILLLFFSGFIVYKYRYFFFPTINTHSSTNTPAPKMLFIGIDGADPDTLERLMNEGRMPNLKYLVENGVSAKPRPPIPVISTAAWTTIATGMQPSKHGIDNFFTKTENAGEHSYTQSTDRRVKALWNIFTDANYRVGMFDWEASYPIEETLGYVVSDGIYFDYDTSVTPDKLRTDLKSYLARIIGLDVLTQGDRLIFPTPKNENDAEFFRVATEKIALYDDLVIKGSQFAYATQRPEILLQLDNVLDAAQHLFLKFQRPEEYPGTIDPTLLNTYRTYLDDLYAERDVYIGSLLETADENTHIIVASDSGFFVDGAQGYRFDEFGTILELLGLLKKNSDGSINYAETIAFECFNNAFDWQRNLCINLEGRYTNGSVTQASYEQTRTMVMQKIQSLVTSDGESIFHTIGSSNVADADISYDIKRSIVDTDIIVGDNTYPAQRFMTLAIESGSHYANPLGPPAFFVWKGPGIAKGIKAPTIKFVDYVPNILHAFGLPIAKDMDGTYLPILFTHPIEPQYIDTYEENPLRLNQGKNQFLSESDKYTINDNAFSLDVTIGEKDDYKAFCFETPGEPDNYLIHTDSLTWATNKINSSATNDTQTLRQPIDIARDIILANLPHHNTQRVFPDAFIPQPNSDDLYAILAPLDATRNQTMALWTNMYITSKASYPGMMRIIARGDDINGVYPTFDIAMNGEVINTISLTSSELRAYDIPIPKSGIVRISYTNDAIEGNKDRNAYIEEIIFTQNNTFDERYNDITMTIENNQFCISVAKKGHVLMKGTLDKPRTEFTDIGQGNADDLWQKIGEIQSE